MVHQLTARPRHQQPNKPHQVRRRPRSLLWLSSLVFVVAALGVAEKRLRVQAAEPQAAVVLGGLEARESYAAQLAQRHPELEIWVSSGSPEDYVKRIFARAGVGRDRLHLNYEAKDTVTNFTTLLDDLQTQGITSVYLITSENHMRRARIVGEIVFGSHGILIKPLPVKSAGANETLAKSALDGMRAIFWLITGETGAELKDKLAVLEF
ncbi:MAG: YdcF family protein [Spirulina sp. SIO3F2]|nr:YdcF family protein [Spirulina sp. SIO3F2]